MNLEEERRLMYVAMTRAMERLIITYRKRQSSHFIQRLTDLCSQIFY